MKRVIAAAAALIFCLSALCGCLEKPEGNHAASSVTESATDHGTVPATETGKSGAEMSGTETELRETEAETTGAETAPEETEAKTTADTEPPAVYDIENFDAELMEFIASKTDDSFMISPLSFKYALGMLLAGAGGESKTGLMTALGIKNLSEFEDLIKEFNRFAEGFEDSFARELEEYREGVKKGWYGKDDPEPCRVLRVADSVWKRNDIPEDFKEDYKMRLQMYGAEHRGFDLSSVIRDVNDWANEKTEGMIPRLLPDDYDVSDLAVILMNALYFKNSWKDKFEKGAENGGDFTTADGKTVKKTFMSVSTGCRYYKDDKTELAAVKMNGNTEMVFVLGDLKNVADKIKKAENRDVTVKVPLFETETSLDKKELCDFLKSRGADEIFDERADFSEMTDRDIYVSDIIQKTKIKLDQNGVEAAAVTAVFMPEKSAYEEPKTYIEFTADRAFSYYIITAPSDWTSSSGTVLFEGRLVK